MKSVNMCKQIYKNKKAQKCPFLGVSKLFKAQGKRDSNPHGRFWRPESCRWMIPLGVVK